jgi:dTDP-4-amino-4,6-dideoxygalactose transaminase
MKRPAVLGGAPAFPDGVAFARPATPSLDRVMARLAPSWDDGQLTNGRMVRELEERAADRLGAPHVVAVSSCTDGLILVLRALLAAGDSADDGVKKGVTAVMPSFTFSATGHAARWNGAHPSFVECDPSTFQIDVTDAGRRLGADSAAVVMATHIFGAPCPAEQVEALAAEAGIPVLFDAAHAFGATRQGRPIGSFGDAEIFSLSPTKVVVAGEGGLVATKREDIAEAVRIGRDYGNPGDYNTRFAGLNSRMSELHASVALESLADLDANLALRQSLAERYREGLSELAGVHCQQVDPGDMSTYKDFTVTIDSARFGLQRDLVRRALSAEGVDTRCYFDPPLHRQHAYADLPRNELPITDRTSSRVLSLPMWSALPPTAVDGIVEIFFSLACHAEAIGAAS